MFEHLNSYSRIVVTGPLRSGTTITTYMIAADTGHRAIDEGEYGAVVSRFRDCLVEENIVVQAPIMFYEVMENPPAETLVVFMRRSIDEINASRERVSWQSSRAGSINHPAGFIEINKQINVPHRSDQYWANDPQNSPYMIYERWDSGKKPSNFLEVEYSSLADHHMWVPAELRKNFMPKQIGLQKYAGSK